MTREEARSLAVGDKVMWKNDPKDSGVVTDIDSAWLTVLWKGDAQPSKHRLDQNVYVKDISRRPGRASSPSRSAEESAGR
jgi:hypothetical protein